MLVLKRMISEEIVITSGDTRIVVAILDAGNGWARIGIKAPASVTVHRREIQQQIDDEEKKD